MNGVKNHEVVILIVDDNPKNLQILGKTLKENDYRVEFAIDGMSALEWIKNQNFDLILLDVVMPEMNGFEVCTKIRSDPKFNDVPVIFLTAETEKESILKGFELGAQDYVTKPFDTRELMVRVKTHLELKTSKERLKLMNEYLEQKVQERTSQLKNSNEKLEKANVELKRLDMAKAEFLQLISHEIRTPLNGIISPVQLLKDQIESGDLSELVNILDLSVSRLEKFSYNALTITRLRIEKDKISKQIILLKELIESSLTEVSEKINEKNIRLDIPKFSKSISIKGEFDILKTCFVNILENAVKYSVKKGCIKIKISQEKNLITCEIEDHGKGFSTESLNKLFKLFSSGEQHIDQNLGLGLALVKLIMDAHSGRVEISNRKTGGASVKLIFKES